MKREQKERVVDELTQRLEAAETLLVADYRGLTMPQIDDLRSRLLASGARFTVVKNTLTRRAAEAAGADALLALLDGPSAIAFLETDGDMVAAAKALADSARETHVLEIRGGIMQGRVLSAADVESLATLPPEDVLHSQVLGAIIAPVTALAGLLNAPLQNLVGLIDARIDQLGGEETEAPSEPEAVTGGADGDSEVVDEPGRASAGSPPTLAATEESAEDPTPADATASAAEEEVEPADSETQEEN